VAPRWGGRGVGWNPAPAAAAAGPCIVRAGDAVPALIGHRATHILWATGGGMLPDEDFAAILAAGDGG